MTGRDGRTLFELGFCRCAIPLALIRYPREACGVESRLEADVEDEGGSTE